MRFQSIKIDWFQNRYVEMWRASITRKDKDGKPYLSDAGLYVFEDGISRQIIGYNTMAKLVDEACAVYRIELPLSPEELSAVTVNGEPADQWYGKKFG